MDDKKVFELKRLEMAYRRQLLFMFSVIVVALIGLVLYISTIYRFNFQLLLVAVMLMAVGVISMLTIDTGMKEISGKIKEL